MCDLNMRNEKEVKKYNTELSARLKLPCPRMFTADPQRILQSSLLSVVVNALLPSFGTLFLLSRIKKD